MANLQEMLKCEHVEWKRLGEVCAIRKGDVITKREAQEGDVPVIAGGAKPAYYHNKSNREGGTIVVAASGTAGLVSYWDIPIFVSDAFSVEPNEELNKRYLYHWLLSNQENIYQLNKGGVVPHVYARDLLRLLIPIPPIEVQIEIVRILDAFNTLIEELLKKLESELDLRKKQYAYYLEKLLSEEGLKRCEKMLGEEGSLCWAKIGEVCNLQRGRVISKIYLQAHKGAHPVYSSQTKNSGEIGAIDTYDFDGEYATWTTDGAYAGTVFYRNGKFSITNIAGLISCKNKDQLLVKFVVYWLQIEAKKHVSYGSGNHKLMIHAMSDVPIPIPSLKVQSYVVDVLDKFSALVEETEGALLDEIEMRKKQYEYYRDALLKFEK